MKIIDCEQGTPEWIKARLGIPTASNFDRIITPKGSASSSAPRYLADLAAEWFLGEPIDDVKSQFMERGSELEQDARNFYEFDTNQKITKVGLCLTDDGKIGCSPDGLVGDDGLWEGKTPSAGVHTSYFLGGMPNDYFVQVQGQLWVTERKWVDLDSYNPVLPKVRKRYERDEPFIRLLDMRVRAFVVELDAAKERLAPEKLKRERAMAEAAETDDTPF